MKGGGGAGTFNPDRPSHPYQEVSRNNGHLAGPTNGDATILEVPQEATGNPRFENGAPLPCKIMCSESFQNAPSMPMTMRNKA